MYTQEKERFELFERQALAVHCTQWKILEPRQESLTIFCNFLFY